MLKTPRLLSLSSVMVVRKRVFMSLSAEKLRSQLALLTGKATAAAQTKKLIKHFFEWLKEDGKL